MCSCRVGSPLGKMDRFLLHIPIQKDDDDVDFFTISDTRIYGGKERRCLWKGLCIYRIIFPCEFRKTKALTLFHLSQFDREIQRIYYVD